LKGDATLSFFSDLMKDSLTNHYKRLQLHLNIIAGKDAVIWSWLSNSEENKWHREDQANGP